MADSDSKSSVGLEAARARGAWEVIVDAAVDSLVSAWLVWVLGGVALSIAGGFAGDMIPTLPPAFSGQQLEANPAHGFAWWNVVKRDAFGLFYAIFFLHALWQGFNGEAGAPRGRVSRILANVRKDWFSLIVGNAIQAWAAVLVLGIAQQVSVVQIMWHAVADIFMPTLHAIAQFVLGKQGTASLNEWISWYGTNHSKLNFWIIYFGGAFDDMGVPNFKTLFRWTWRRMRKRAQPAPPAPVQQCDSVPTPPMERSESSPKFPPLGPSQSG